MHPGEKILGEEPPIESVGSTRGRQQPDQAAIDTINRLVDGIITHWLLLVNGALVLTLAGAVLVPFLRTAGLEFFASGLTLLYRLICLQRPAHSYFLFGHQVVLEQRMLAMFAAQLLGGLVYGLVRRRGGGLNWRLLIVFSLPLAWDGFSQLFGLRESDWFTRTWTGGLFNVALAFWLYPRVDRALTQARRKSTQGLRNASVP